MSELFSKERYFLVVQADSITGEAAGDAIGRLYEAGALNVQVVATITKKNRPGSMFFIDCSEDCLESAENVILREIGVTGWHRVRTEHCYVAVRIVEKQAIIKAGDRQFPFTIQRKESSAEPEIIRPEHENCVLLRKMLLEECGVSASLPSLREKIITGFLQDYEPAEIVFR